MITFKQYNFLTKIINPTDRIITTNVEKIVFRTPKEQPSGGVDKTLAANSAIPGKPLGLWYAIGSAWLDWMKQVKPEWLDRYHSVFKIDINTTKILHLSNYKQLINFTKQYGRNRAPLTSPFALDMPTKYLDINWQNVASDYYGIEISPYIHQARHKLLWYYYWDVASGCIWNKKAIIQFTRIKF